MSKKFHAVHRKTGERWKPSGNDNQFLVLYDSGYAAVVTEQFYTFITPLDPRVWKVVVNDSLCAR